MKHTGASLLLLAGGLVTTHAAANGSFPASGQVLRDPSNADIVWVSTTVGLAKSVDGGRSFRLLCEPGIGYEGGFHPFFALTPSGAIFGGLPDGLASSRGDTCSFSRAPELDASFVADVSVGLDGRAIAVALPPAPGRARVLQSLDDLASWQPVGAELPSKLVPLTLDAAPSDPSRLYVTAISEGDTPIGMVVRSTDGGATWSSFVVPGSSSSAGPFLAAIDPADADRFYLRLNGAPGKLLLSTDGGESYEELFATRGFLRAFDLDQTGDYALFGGDQDGLFRLDTRSLTIEPRSTVAARCVNIDGAEVFACGTPALDGFSAGVSHDGGVTFAPLLDQACIEGMLDCPSGTTIGDSCPDLWPMIAELIGAEACEPTGQGGAGGATAGTGAATGAAAAQSSSAGGGAPADESSGCSCGAAGPTASGVRAAALAVLAGALGLRRRSAVRRG